MNAGYKSKSFGIIPILTKFKRPFFYISFSVIGGKSTNGFNLNYFGKTLALLIIPRFLKFVVEKL